MQHPLPHLPCPRDALELHISEIFLAYHHGNHHAAYPSYIKQDDHGHRVCQPVAGRHHQYEQCRQPSSPCPPLLSCDVWEHALSRLSESRADYLQAFWQLLGWEFVHGQYAALDAARQKPGGDTAAIAWRYIATAYAYRISLADRTKTGQECQTAL